MSIQKVFCTSFYALRISQKIYQENVVPHQHYCLVHSLYFVALMFGNYPLQTRKYSQLWYRLYLPYHAYALIINQVQMCTHELRLCIHVLGISMINSPRATFRYREWFSSHYGRSVHHLYRAVSYTHLTLPTKA